MYAHRLCECHTWNIPLLRQDRTRGSECTPVSTPHLAADCLREVQIKAIVSWSEHHWFRGIFYTAVWDSTGSADTTPGSRVSLHVSSFPFTRRNVFSGSQFKVSETDIKFSCHKVLVDNETNKTKQSYLCDPRDTCSFRRLQSGMRMNPFYTETRKLIAGLLINS